MFRLASVREVRGVILFEITCRLIIHASRHIVAVTTSKWRVTSLDGYVKGNRLLLKRWDYHGDRWQSRSYPKVNWLAWMLCGRICEQVSCFCVSVRDEIKKVCSRQPEILKAQRGSLWMGDCEMYTGAQACIKGFWLQYETEIEYQLPLLCLQSSGRKSQCDTGNDGWREEVKKSLLVREPVGNQMGVCLSGWVPRAYAAPCQCLSISAKHSLIERDTLV